VPSVLPAWKPIPAPPPVVVTLNPSMRTELPVTVKALPPVAETTDSSAAGTLRLRASTPAWAPFSVSRFEIETCSP
jgi:hypothetical protein